MRIPFRSTLGDCSEIFWVALRLGCTSFGGPIAHLGYFERHYVRRLQWLDESQYAALVAYCSALPGPTSSQVGFLIGLRRAGWGGALAAWTGFTLPSALLMYLAATVPLPLQRPAVWSALHGLMLTAVAVVGHAVWSMQRTLCPDAWRRALAIVAGAVVLLAGGSVHPLAVLAGAALAGLIMGRGASPPVAAAHAAVTMTASRISLVVMLGTYAVLTALATFHPRGPLALAHVFFCAGLVVFGCGHVVLPLLQSALIPAGWVSEEHFLTAYGLAQALPGPLFAVSANLGAIAAPGGLSFGYALLALCAMFLPGLLACVAALSILRQFEGPHTGAALAGVNAGVVGVLAAAFCIPVWSAAVNSGIDVLVVVAGFVLLLRRKASPLWVPALCVAVTCAAERLR